eukprot:10053154-Alexandrium_andersonii.AAC.1
MAKQRAVGRERAAQGGVHATLSSLQRLQRAGQGRLLVEGGADEPARSASPPFSSEAVRLT